jgi:thymidylate synthase
MVVPIHYHLYALSGKSQIRRKRLMRIFRNFEEALGEIKRDLSEMGLEVHPQTMQDKVVEGDTDYFTKELQNYDYTVKDAMQSIDQLSPVQPWADAEFKERVSGLHLKPGTAWLHRPEVWTEFLHDGQFAYTYPDRMADSLGKIIEELKKHPESRQLYLNIWEGTDLNFLGGGSRVPCSLGYLFQLRYGKLNITYMMRSCDFVTHFQNDVYLATRLMNYVAEQAGVQPGNFSHFIGSFHIYKKDTQGVF